MLTKDERALLAAKGIAAAIHSAEGLGGREPMTQQTGIELAVAIGGGSTPDEWVTVHAFLNTAIVLAQWVRCGFDMKDGEANKPEDWDAGYDQLTEYISANAETIFGQY